MTRKGFAFICVAGLLALIVACQPANNGPIVLPGGGGSDQITAEVVAKGFDLGQLNTDIQSELSGIDVIGLEAKLLSADPSASIAANSLSRAGEAPEARTVPAEAFILVKFDGYRQNDGATVVNSGEMVLAAKGVPDVNALSLNSYSAKTVTALSITTTVGYRTSTDNVSVTIPSAQISGKVTADADGNLTSSELSIEEPASGTGATIQVGRTEVPVDKVSDDGTQEGFNGLFAGGYGTESDPYIIETAAQFANLGNSDMQEIFLSGNGKNLYFSLERSIDISGYDMMIADVFAGHLIGNGNTITTGDSMPYIFHYFMEHAYFEDLTIRFGGHEVTLLVKYAAAISNGSNFAGNRYYTDEDELNLSFNNVDYVAGDSDYYYTVGDNNYALYAYGSIAQTMLHEDGETKWGWASFFIDSNEKPVPYKIEIKGCDVDGNFFGGFTASGAAIFVGGQLFGVHVDIDDCSFDGTLTGSYTSLLIGNVSSFYQDSDNPVNTLTVGTISGTGRILSFTGKGGVWFANEAGSNKVGNATTTVAYETFSPDDAIQLTVSADSQITVSLKNGPLNGVGFYQVKFNLPTLYWYDNETDSETSGETNSNPFTIDFESIDSVPEMYAAKPITKYEADEVGFTGLDWTAASVSAEGYPYIFADHGGTKYLVIDYGEDDILMYSDSGVPSEGNLPSSMPKSIIVVARGDDGEILGASNLVNP